MSRHAQRKCLDALQELEGVGRAHRRTEVAQALGPGPGDEGGGTELVGEGDAVVPDIGLGHRVEAARRFPVEAAAVDQCATQCNAVATEEFRDGVHHDVGPVLDRTDAVGRREGRVDHQREPVTVRHLGDGRDVEDLDTGVAEGFGEHEAGLVGDGVLECLRVSRIDEGGGDPESGKGHIQHLVGAAIDVAAGDDVTALAHQGDDPEKEGRLTARRADRPDPAFERCETLLEHGDRRVGETRVEMPGHLQVEQPSRVVGVVEHIGGGEIQGHCPGPGGGVRLLARMQAQRVETQEIGLDHGADPIGRHHRRPDPRDESWP